MFVRIAGIVSLLSFVSLAQGQRIYFAEKDQKIYRADPDGSNIQVAVDFSPGGLHAIALDVDRGGVFWTSGGADIYRANLDGTGKELWLTSPTPSGIAVDPIDGWVFWGVDFDFTTEIRRADRDGSFVETIYIPENISAPERLVVDPLGRKLYWTESDFGEVRRSNLDGTQVELLITVPSSLETWGIALDPIRRKLYWSVTAALSDSIPGKIQRANLDGSDVEDLFTLAPIVLSEVAIDPYLEKIYWTDSFTIRRANLDGTGIEDIIPTTLEYAGAIAIERGRPIPAASQWGLVILLLGLLSAGTLLLRCRVMALGGPKRWIRALVFVGLLVSGSRSAFADWQDEPEFPIVLAPCNIASDVLYPPPSGTDPVLLWSALLQCAESDSPWVRFHFQFAVLGGSPAAGNGSFLRLTSLADGAVQIHDAVSLPKWNKSTAYFAGHLVRVELFAYPGTGGNDIKLDRVLYPAYGPNCAEIPAGTCGAADDRVPSADARAARFRIPQNCLDFPSETWCSSFLIANGANWFLAAAHCCDNVFLGCGLFPPLVEFGVPTAQEASYMAPAPPERQFPVSTDSIEYPALHALGNDWCFFGAHRNSNTNLTPVQSQGATYRLPTALPPANGSTLRVTGYGVDLNPYTHCGIQQTATGAYTVLDGTKVYYTVDAQTRNSGSPVESVCGAVYAILTNGECGLPTGANIGTAVTHPDLQDALTPGGTLEPTDVAADCNGNGIKDWCDVSCGPPGGACQVSGCGGSANCNANLIPDECEPDVDCNVNSVRDSCEVGSPTVPDCNGNGVPDSCDLATEFSADGNCNQIPDECDICVGTETDTNNNWVPDAYRACCRPAPWDDCVLTTQPCCQSQGGTFKPSSVKCTVFTCGAPNGPSGGG